MAVTFTVAVLEEFEDIHFAYGVSDEYVNHIKQFIDGNIGSLIKSIKDILLSITSNVFSNTMGFFTFMGLTLFCLFFFYIDGHKVIDNLKAISPLHDDLDQYLTHLIYTPCKHTTHT